MRLLANENVVRTEGLLARADERFSREFTQEERELYAELLGSE